MADTTITPRPNGPYLVRGSFQIVDADGNEFQYDHAREQIALCRCGGSVNKPFCDGTHSKIGFDAATKAVQEAEKKE